MPERGMARVGFVLKGYPRISELFIASEIHRLEEAGLDLGLFVLKPAEEGSNHRLVGRIRAPVERLPAVSPISSTPAHRWLRRHLPDHRGALRRLAVAAPAELFAAAGAAAAQAVRSRRRPTDWPRKVYLKEFLQAAWIADRLRADPAIRHLHAHFCHGAATVAWLAARMAGVGFSFTAHAKDLYRGDLNPAGLLRRKLRAARFAVACTEANRRELLRIEPAARVVRVYHGLNAELEDLLREAPARRVEPTGRFRVLGVGRRVAKKGFDLAVDAVAGLLARGIEAELLLAGPEGEVDGELRRCVRDRGLRDRVRFLGPVSQSELLRLLGEADAFCLPCRVLADGDRDGIPNVLVEAMAAGVPVVSTRVSGIPELVRDGANGILVEPEDAGALADALARLATNEGLRRTLAEGGVRTVREHFDGRRLAESLAALFREVAGRGAPPCGATTGRSVAGGASAREVRS